jgi:hypothetical protein
VYVAAPLASGAFARLTISTLWFLDFADHEKLRRNKYRAQRLMLAREGRSAKDATQWGLEEEMEFLDRMQKKERRSSQYFNLAISLSSFLIFWVLGAVVFKYAGAYAPPVAHSLQK